MARYHPTKVVHDMRERQREREREGVQKRRGIISKVPNLNLKKGALTGALPPIPPIPPPSSPGVASRARTLMMCLKSHPYSQSIALHLTRDIHLGGYRNDLENRYVFLNPSTQFSTARPFNDTLWGGSIGIEVSRSSSTDMVISDRSSRSPRKGAAPVSMEWANQEASLKEF